MLDALATHPRHTPTGGGRLVRVLKRLALVSLCLLYLSSCEPTHPNRQHGYIEGKLTYLAASVSGYLDDILVSRGQQVEPGQVLCQLDPQPELSELHALQAQMKVAEANLANLLEGQRETIILAIQAQQQQAQAQLDLANATLKRSRELFRKKVIARAQLDDDIAAQQNAAKRVEEIKANLAEAKQGARDKLIDAQRATIEAIQANIEKQQWIVEQKVLRAQTSATIYDVFYRIGEFVQAGQPIVSMLAPENILLVFYLPQSRLSQLHPGDSLRFTCDGCDGSQKATVAFISQVAEYTPPVLYTPTSRDKLVYRVEANLQPAAGFHYNAGQPVDIELPAPTRTESSTQPNVNSEETSHESES